MVASDGRTGWTTEGGTTSAGVGTTAGAGVGAGEGRGATTGTIGESKCDKARNWSRSANALRVFGTTGGEVTGAGVATGATRGGACGASGADDGCRAGMVYSIDRGR